MEKEVLEAWITSTLVSRGDTHLFLVEMEWKPSKKRLDIFIDHDHKLTLASCKDISRYLEKKLDEAGIIGEEYHLTVSSPGLNRPLRLRRQYNKNVGRVVRMRLIEGGEKIGRLVKVSESQCWLAPEIKQKKHKRAAYGDPVTIPFSVIKETFVEVRF